MRATTQSNKPSPMRMLRAWLFRERALRPGPAIELDVMERQVEREERAVSAAVDEAGKLERKLDSVRRELACDLANDGVVDAVEANRLARALINAAVTAHHHKGSLEALT